MVKQFIASLLLSLLVIGAFSGALAFLFSPLLPFWSTALASAVVLFVGVTSVKSFFEQKRETAELDILSKIDIEDERNNVIITCPCQQNTFYMRVYPTMENEYVCTVCKNSFTVNVSIDPVLQTNPINLDNAYKIFETLREKEDIE